MSTEAKTEGPAALPASKTALLVLDYQNLVVSMIQNQEEKDKVLSSVSELLDTARQNSARIVHCLIGFDQEPPQSNRMKGRWDDQIKPALAARPDGSEEWADFLAPEGSKYETTVAKVPGSISAMKSKGILQFLQDQGQVESLVIVGISTSGAVLSTAREAADLGFVTTVVEDGCWDPLPESHRVILSNVLPMNAWVVGQQKGLELLRG